MEPKLIAYKNLYELYSYFMDEIENADKLRGSMDAAEYKNVALGIIFLKYVSDSLRKNMKNY